jgi:hypothetical protein
MHRDPFQKEKEKGTLIKGSQVDSQRSQRRDFCGNKQKIPISRLRKILHVSNVEFTLGTSVL